MVLTFHTVSLGFMFCVCVCVCLFLLRACSFPRNLGLTFTSVCPCVSTCRRANLPTHRGMEDHTTNVTSVHSCPLLDVSQPHVCHHEEQTRFKQSLCWCKGNRSNNEVLEPPHHPLPPLPPPTLRTPSIAFLCPPSLITFCVPVVFSLPLPPVVSPSFSPSPLLLSPPVRESTQRYASGRQKSCILFSGLKRKLAKIESSAEKGSRKQREPHGKMGVPTMAEQRRGKIWKTMTWATFGGTFQL